MGRLARSNALRIVGLGKLSKLPHPSLGTRAIAGTPLMIDPDLTLVEPSLSAPPR